MPALGVCTLRDLIESLPSGERRLLLLRYASRLSIEEIAGLEGEDVDRVEARLGALEDVLFAQVQARLERELASDASMAA
jgi:DNA-directed RNA polymerase specialized sigma24 family protein